MKKISGLLIIFLILLCAGFLTPSCEKVGAEIPGSEDASADALISPTLTIMNLNSGLKTGERIVDKDFSHARMRYQIEASWNPQNGDIFFLRGDMVRNDHDYDKNIYGDYLIITPLEEEFYWNGVCLYYDGFCYQITRTEDGLRIYNRGLWTLRGYCVIVQAGSSLALPELGINTEMLRNVHKLKVKRGHLKVAEMNPNIEGAFTPPGLIWKYYKNQGKEIRPASAGEYLKAEDFIVKTDADNGYFQSLTSELQIKKVSIFNDPQIGGVDCSKVY